MTTAAAPRRSAGRPRLPDDERRRDLTVRMHPAKRAAYEAAAARERVTLTAWLESAADARLARPDYERIVRAALADSATRTRLAAIVPPTWDVSVLAWCEAQMSGRPSRRAWQAMAEMVERR